MNIQSTEAPRRPRSSDAAIIEVAATALAAECAKWSKDGTSIAEWVDCLRDIRWCNNGYQIAKELDEYHSVEPDEELVEILAGAGSHLYSAREAAIKQWVAANNITPPLTVGDRVNTMWGEGRISGIKADYATYLVIHDGEEEKFANGGGVVINYEDAALIIATEQAA